MQRGGCGSDDAIFPTFFMAGFECSTFVWMDQERKDYVVATGHDRHLKNDFAAAMDLGIGVVRGERGARRRSPRHEQRQEEKRGGKLSEQAILHF